MAVPGSTRTWYGDPACDLAIAWTLFGGASRTAFRAATPADEAMWARGRGWVLWKSLLTMTYCDDTDPEHAENQQIIEDLIEEHRVKG